jgi:hypothetical protein
MERICILQNIKRLIPWLILLSLALTPLQSALAKKGKNKKGKKSKIKKSMRLDKKMKEGYFVGVKLGLNLSWVGSDSEDDVLGETDTYPGLGFGLSIGHAFNDYVGVRAEALWINKNFSHSSTKNYNLGGNKLKTTTYLDYLEIPLLAVIRFNKGAKIRPFITVGGFFSALVMSDGIQKGKTMSEARKPFFAFDGGFIVGAGTYFVLPPGAGFLSVELRYTGGMVNIADNGEEFFANNEEENGTAEETLKDAIYNMNNFGILLGYYF